MSEVYTSQQYKILQDLSAMMTAAVADIPFNKIAKDQLNSKLDKSQEFIFFTQPVSTTYNTSLKIGDEEILKDIQRPVQTLKYQYTPEYTSDTLYNKLSSLGTITSAKSYSEHYVEGSLPSLTLDFSQQLIGIKALEKAITVHNSYTDAHKNLLINYYDKLYIDSKQTEIKNLINNTKTTLETDDTNAINYLRGLLDQHKIDKNCHNYANNLLNYTSLSLANTLSTILNKNLQDHDKSTTAHNYIQSKITEKNLNSFKDQYQYEHTGTFTINNNPQLNKHNNLLRWRNPIVAGQYIVINKDFQINDSTQLSLQNKTTSNELLYGKFSLSKDKNLIIQNGNLNGTGPILVQQTYSSNNTWKLNHSVTLMDSNGNSEFNKISCNSVTINNTIPTSDNSKQAATTQWVRTYHNSNTQYNPYDSMPDYANILDIFGNNVYNDNIIKVNVPGYIQFYPGHCSDCDMAIYASYNSQYLITLTNEINYDKVVKLSQCFGYGDRDQSIIFLPIFPGTQTYLLLSNDYSGGNIDNAYWTFIPALGVRHVTTNHEKYITKIKTQKRSHKNINTVPTTNIYSKTFNTLQNPNIWKNNFPDWA